MLCVRPAQAVGIFYLGVLQPLEDPAVLYVSRMGLLDCLLIL